jgi:Terminase large subunit, T4likevirus-type, N-terminal
MTDPRELARQILRLPSHERRMATAAFVNLVLKRREQTPPVKRSAIELAEAVGLAPDPWQQKLLESEAKRILLNCSRQAGKSSVTALLAVHAALYDPGALILLLSPSMRQSQELFRKALDTYRALDRPVSAEAESALRLELTNGSRIVSLPGKDHTVRGFSGVRLLAIDEAARVPDELYLSVRPMLAVSGGRLVALSTPFGTRGWWYQAWRSSEPWERYQIPATDCPRISVAFLEEEQRAMGEWWYRQEYFCEFLEGQHQPFRREDIDRAFEEEVEVWDL